MARKKQNWSSVRGKDSSVQYKASLNKQKDLEWVAVDGHCATLWRAHKMITQFVVSSGQKKKILSKTGTLNITLGMIRRGLRACPRR